VIRKIIKVDVKVTSDDEFMRCGSSKREKRIKFIQKKKQKKGCENVEDEGGRQILNTDILE